ncbi:MAG: tetratricopeptide repeat protein, partial [Saprospiraceae bacterium]|nr:tetratricopeptide repeat protein [Pyrinomonadaceae bacterium]
RPFADETANDTIAAILTREPAPLNESIPLELQRIVKKALQKKPDERYHTVKDFLLDVKNLKRELEFSEELERFRIPAFPKSTNGGLTQSGESATEMHAAAISTQNSLAAGQMSGTKYLINEVTKRKLVSVLGIFLAALVGLGFLYGHSATGPVSINSVAVLPFVNVGGDPEEEYLSDGISEALINNLSRLPRLKVIARTSSFQYKGKEIDPREVAKELGVEVIVTGSVTRRGDNMNISVEMINAADKTRIWGETYSRTATDTQNIQEEITRMVSENLRPRLEGGQHQQIAKSETKSSQAYDMHLRGWFLMRRGGQANLNQAIELFEQAIAIDPNYARAYASLSIAFSNIYGLGLGDQNEFRPKQEVAVRKAVELDPNLEDARNALAVFLTRNFQWVEAEQEFKRAIEINQNFAGARANYARLLSSTKRHEQAVAETRRAIEIDPLRAEVYSVLPEMLTYARRYDEAIDAAKKAIEMNPKEPSGFLRLADAYSHKKMYPEAVAADRRSVELDGGSLATQIILGATLAQAGERSKAEEILRKTLTAKDYVSPVDLARFYIALGEPKKALSSLEKAYTERDGGLQFLAVDPAFDQLRTDWRFADLLHRIGLPK